VRNRGAMVCLTGTSDGAAAQRLNYYFKAPSRVVTWQLPTWKAGPLAKPFERARDEAAAALSVPNKRASITRLDAVTGLKYVRHSDNIFTCCQLLICFTPQLLADLAKQYDEGVQPLNVMVKDPQDRCHVSLRLISAHQAICRSVKDSNGEVANGVKGRQPLLRAWFKVSWKTSSKRLRQKGISIGPQAMERGDSPNTIIANLGTQVLLINLLNQNRSIVSRKRGTGLPLQSTRNGSSYPSSCHAIILQQITWQDIRCLIHALGATRKGDFSVQLAT
jgi:hypothetical protein